MKFSLIIFVRKANDMKQYTYRILLNKEPEGGFTVTVPALPGCITYGETMEEAIANAKEAVELFLKSLTAHGEPIPTEENTFEYSSILILGTFNPDSKDNEAEFFYGRPHNHMWKLLPMMFNENNLKGASVEKKKEFILRHSIDFLDLIEAVEVEQVLNYNDSYIDSRVLKWRNVIEVISNLKSLKRVYFTRKTFSGIPNMQKRIEEIQRFCLENNIQFYFLPTPARFTNEAKISEWHNLFKP